MVMMVVRSLRRRSDCRKQHCQKSYCKQSAFDLHTSPRVQLFRPVKPDQNRLTMQTMKCK